MGGGKINVGKKIAKHNPTQFDQAEKEGPRGDPRALELYWVWRSGLRVTLTTKVPDSRFFQKICGSFHKCRRREAPAGTCPDRGSGHMTSGDPLQQAPPTSKVDKTFVVSVSESQEPLRSVGCRDSGGDDGEALEVDGAGAGQDGVVGNGQVHVASRTRNEEGPQDGELDQDRAEG